jgi:hypothetical protein
MIPIKLSFLFFAYLTRILWGSQASNPIYKSGFSILPYTYSSLFWRMNSDQV